MKYSDFPNGWACVQQARGTGLKTGENLAYRPRWAADGKNQRDTFLRIAFFRVGQDAFSEWPVLGLRVNQRRACEVFVSDDMRARPSGLFRFLLGFCCADSLREHAVLPVNDEVRGSKACFFLPGFRFFYRFECHCGAEC